MLTLSFEVKYLILTPLLPKSSSRNLPYFTLNRFFRADGTRIAAVSFGTEAKLEFNLGDAKVDSIEKAIEAIDNIVYMGGATASALALQMVRKVVVPNARGDSHRVIMFITDGMSNIGGPPKKEAKHLREVENFEIYAVGKISFFFSPNRVLKLRRNLLAFNCSGRNKPE